MGVGIFIVIAVIAIVLVLPVRLFWKKIMQNKSSKII
jgi:hypothetical protein